MSDLNASTALTPVVLSDEQAAIARFAAEDDRNFLVRARAGTGKSFTLRQIAPLMRGATIVLVFGAEAKKDMESACQRENLKIDVSTFHSAGLRALRGSFSKAKIVNSNEKFDRIATELQIPEYLQGFTFKAMSLAMQRGFGVFFPANDPAKWYELVEHFSLEDLISEDNAGRQLYGIEELIKKGCAHALKAISHSMKLLPEIVSFDDMMYAPLRLNCKFKMYANVLVDEAQDSNDCRIEIARRMAERLGFVGDDLQAIMGFTGANNDALDKIKETFGCVEFPLTVTRRCSQAVVRRAQTICSDYKAHDSNVEGSDTSMAQKDFAKLALVPGQDAVICRKTAPLVPVAYSLIARSIAAKVYGKDIGSGLSKLAARWSRIKTLPALRAKLEDHRETEMAKLIAKKANARAEALSDKVETLFVLIDALPPTATVVDLKNQIDSLFADNIDGTKAPTVALMTAHKSKGLEFTRVFGYGNDLWFPSKYATKEWELAQEKHLLYVLWTRAKVDYVDVAVEA